MGRNGRRGVARLRWFGRDYTRQSWIGFSHQYVARTLWASPIEAGKARSVLVESCRIPVIGKAVLVSQDKEGPVEAVLVPFRQARFLPRTWFGVAGKTLLVGSGCVGGKSR